MNEALFMHLHLVFLPSSSNTVLDFYECCEVRSFETDLYPMNSVGGSSSPS